MPYASDAQRRYFNANRDELEAEGVDVDEWNAASEGKDLPEKAKKKDPEQEKDAASPGSRKHKMQQRAGGIKPIEATAGPSDTATAAKPAIIPGMPTPLKQPAKVRREPKSPLNAAARLDTRHLTDTINTQYQRGKVKVENSRQAADRALQAARVLAERPFTQHPALGRSVTPADYPAQPAAKPPTKPATNPPGQAAAPPTKPAGLPWLGMRQQPQAMPGQKPIYETLNELPPAAQSAQQPQHPAYADWTPPTDEGFFEHRWGTAPTGTPQQYTDPSKYLYFGSTFNVFGKRRSDHRVVDRATGQIMHTGKGYSPMQKGGSDNLFEFLPDDVHSARLAAAIADITKASSDLTAQLGEFRGDAHRVTHHTGQDGQVREKLADASVAISPGQPQALSAPIAPSTNNAQFNTAADQLACFEHHETPWLCPWTWQGQPQQAQQGTSCTALGYPIDHGKLGNGPGIGGLGGGGGVPIEKTADTSASCSAEQDSELEKEAAPAWLANLAGKASKGMTGWDPTFKSGIIGAGLGAGVGGLAGGLSNLTGGYRPAITEEVASYLQASGVDQRLIQKLLAPDREGELEPDEIRELSQAGIDYDEIAPKPGRLGGLMSGVAKGGLIGGAAGGLGGVALQELPRLFAGTQAPGVAGEQAKSMLPSWAPKWTQDWSENIGSAAGKHGWNAMSRPQQFDVTEQAMGRPLPASIIDSALGRLSKTSGTSMECFEALIE